MRARSKNRKNSAALSAATMECLQRALSQVDSGHDVLVDMDGTIERVERPLPMKPIPEIRERDGVE